MHRCVVCIGSNYRRQENLLLARRRMTELYPDIRFTREQETQPLYFKNEMPFSNQMAVFFSEAGEERVKQELKAIEQAAGRCPGDKQEERICLDIDLLMFDNLILKPEDWTREYIKKGIEELKDNKDMRFLGIIPARYASTRFPGKPLAMLGGKPMIERVYEQVASRLDEVYVATDDERIEAAVRAFGGKVVMTSANHRSGTDRCYEAYAKIGGGFDVVVNIQGDEPFIQPSQLEAVKACFADNGTQIATLVKPFTAADTYEALENVNSPKVVVDKQWNALYFSRSIIPFQRNADRAEWLKGHTYYKHIGLYAYRVEVLQEITALQQSPLELAESLEQLRWLENGYKIKVGISEVETIGIDTPEDLERAEQFLKNNR